MFRFPSVIGLGINSYSGKKQNLPQEKKSLAADFLFREHDHAVKTTYDK